MQAPIETWKLVLASNWLGSKPPLENAVAEILNLPAVATLQTVLVPCFTHASLSVNDSENFTESPEAVLAPAASK